MKTRKFCALVLLFFIWIGCNQQGKNPKQGSTEPQCVPGTCQSLAKNCGSTPDGCEGVIECGTCMSPYTCGGGGTPNVCGCTPEIDLSFCEQQEAECGSITGEDNCNQIRTAKCGTCPPNLVCGIETPNKCACKSETDAEFCSRRGFSCGYVKDNDNCNRPRGISCGTCYKPKTCGGGGEENVCGCIDDSPDNYYCEHFNIECGSLEIQDDCDNIRLIQCADCEPPDTCDGGGVPFQCGCTPESDDDFCSSQGFNCSYVVAINRCDDPQTFYCGECADGDVCGGQGIANVCSCIPEPDEDLCGIHEYECGDLNITDRCGSARTISCGTCVSPQICGGNGQLHQCGCPPTDAELCANHNIICGTLENAEDACGNTRTIACDLCTAPNTCGGGESPTECGCTPETEAELCSREMSNCDPIGPIQDRCLGSRQVDCGTCLTPLTCGGGPAGANQCGGCTPASCDVAWARWPIPDSRTTGCDPDPYQVCAFNIVPVGPATLIAGQDGLYDINQPSYGIDDSLVASTSKGLTKGVLFDSITGLTWTRRAPLQKMNATDAQQYCQDLNLINGGMGFAQMTDWRLPSIIELISLVDAGRRSPHLYLNDNSGFPEDTDPDTMLWSSITSSALPTHVWLLIMGVDPYVVPALGTEEANALCVSSNFGYLPTINSTPGAPINQFQIDNDNVHDLFTGLTWLVDPSGIPEECDWKSALLYCEDLNVNGFADWRLPSIKELATIIDFKASDPALDSNVFVGIDTDEAEFLWSSTPIRSGTILVFMVEMGFMVNQQESNEVHFICVRNR